MMVPRMTSLENAPSRSEALPRPLGFIASPATPGLAARVPLLIALVTFVVFSPALWNHFVDWDDQVNFLTNNDYRGLGWTHIRWMFTSFLMGQWIPLTWMTLGLDYTLWGMRPLGYHLTNLFLHAANAALCFLVARRLLARAMPSLSGATLTSGAAAARALLVEKAPYIGLAVFTAVMAVWAQHSNRYLTSLESLPVFERGPLALFSLAFYASKTVLPLGLSPLYELPARIHPLESQF